MAIEKNTSIHSIEYRAADKAINVAWITTITEDGVDIAPPSIHRRGLAEGEAPEVVSMLTDFLASEAAAALVENVLLRDALSGHNQTEPTP